MKRADQNVNHAKKEETELYLETGKRYFIEKKYDEALKIFRKALSTGERKNEIFFEIGKLHYILREYNQAALFLTRVFRQSPKHLHAGKILSKTLVELGKIHIEHCEFNKAFKYFKKAKKLNPKEEHVYFSLGRIHAIMGQYNSALTELKRGCRLNPSEFFVHLEMGRVYTRMGELDSAVKSFKKALDINPTSSECREELARVYRQQGRLKNAISEYEQAAKTGRLSSDSYLYLGLLYRKTFKENRSVEIFRKALIEIPKRGNPLLFNKVLNEKELSERKTRLKSLFRPLGVTLTTRCNLKCIMCSSWKFRWDLPKNIISEIKTYYPVLQSIFWQGGEVFLSEDFKELYRKALCYPQMKQIIGTNLLLIDKEWARCLCDHDSTVVLNCSIDGFTEKTYKKIRTGANFSELLEKIGLLNKQRHRYGRISKGRLMFTINFVAMEENYTDLNYAADFARKNGFSSLQIMPRLNTENRLNSYPENMRKQLSDLIEKVKRDASTHGIIVHNMIPLYPIQNVLKENLKKKPVTLTSQKQPYIFCSLPWQKLFISPGGNTGVDCLCGNSAGDVMKESLKEIWNGRKIQKLRKTLLKEEYSECHPVCHFSQSSSGQLEIPLFDWHEHKHALKCCH